MVMPAGTGRGIAGAAVVGAQVLLVLRYLPVSLQLLLMRLIHLLRSRLRTVTNIVSDETIKYKNKRFT